MNTKRWMTCLCVGLLGCESTGGETASKGSSASVRDDVQEGVLSILSYNVHGLPSAITGDDTSGRMESIAPRLGDWDVLGLQEDWDETHHETLIAEVDHETRLWFDERLTNRYYGSGLSVLARYPVVDQHFVHYTTCSGTVSGASDCLASKGFQAVRIDLGGVTLDVYNTHLEAGGGEEDNAARAVQVEDVIASLNGWSEGQAVVFTGDFNLRASDPDDRPLLEQLVAETGLSDSCEATECSESDHIDRVFFRSGNAVVLAGSAWANESSRFMDGEGTDLSDHPPIGATIDWERR